MSHLHEQDMCWVDISVDLQMLADMGGDELVVMSLDVRCNRIATGCQGMCKDHS